MAFAPSSTYYNTGDGSIVGMFTEKDCGNYFEYSMADDFVMHPDLKTGRNTEYPHLVWVTEPWKMDCGYRRALVKKTVAYIVVDENDDGSARIEKWHLKSNKVYGNGQGMPTVGEKLLNRLAS